jgi:hypothetical protein
MDEVITKGNIMTDKMIERFKLIAEDIKDEKKRARPRYFVVYNTRYGGFSISNKAMDLMCEYGHPLALEIRDNYRNRSTFGYLISEIPRHDPILVRVVRELGSEANGQYADLNIVEINTPMYRVQEYDGKEWIETPDSVDWVIIE